MRPHSWPEAKGCRKPPRSKGVREKSRCACSPQDLGCTQGAPGPQAHVWANTCKLVRTSVGRKQEKRKALKSFLK